MPLSFSQERLWFIDKLEGSIQYHIPIVWRLKGELNIDALAKSFREIVNRHEVLRTVILEQGNQTFPSVIDADGWDLDIIDGLPGTHGEETLLTQIQELIRKPFNLSKDYMIRAHLITIGDNENVLVITLHHIASDGWSRSVLVEELTELYNACIEDRPADLLQLPIQYSDYALWQRNYLQGDALDKKIMYWKHKLKGTALLQLPTDYPRPAKWSNRGALLRFNIDKLLSDELHALGKQQGATIFMILLAALKVLLHRYSGQEDICVGSPIANRSQKETEGLIGFFINTLALRSDIKPGMLFKELLQQVKSTTMEAYENQDVPFEKVVGAVVKERNLNRNPLFQVMLVMRNTPKVAAPQLGKAVISRERFTHDTTHFDITISIAETKNGLTCSLEYATDLYNEATINRMVDHYKTLLNSITKNPEQPVGMLPMLTEAEEHQLLTASNGTSTQYQREKSVVDLFEEQALQTPGAVALVFEEQQLTYKQLNEKSNQLAHYLRSKGVKEGSLVPLCIERSIEMVIGILGILKAGAAYVPIDAEYPLERISYMLKDTGAVVAVSNSSNSSKLHTKNQLHIIKLDQDETLLEIQPVIQVQRSLSPEDLCYTMYTSGSTGIPKGVMVTHRNVVSLVKGIDYISLTNGDILLSTGSPSFDATTFEYWSMLLNGGKLILCKEDKLLNVEALKKEIEKRDVNLMWCTAGWFNLLVDSDFTLFERLKTLLVGGEKLSEKHIDKIKQTYPSLNIINGYGPTENTTFSLTYNITEINNSIPIGHPLNNRSVYILDQQQQLVPIGVAGEICLSGDGLSLGYLNQPGLTAEKFIDHTFSKKTGARIYKSGDIGRWRPDGNIEYLGRTDDQVKIRGHRVELGEIESVLLQSGQVKAAAIVARKDSTGSHRLVGYVVPETTFDRETLINYLKSKLPEYMIPTMWDELETLPLTSNGKVDKKSLPDFDATDTVKENYNAPRDDMEKMLTEIWEKVLEIEKVGIYNNFFELGGHSLMILKLANEVRAMGLQIDIKDFFEYQTIEQQSHFIKTSLKLLNTAGEGKFVIPIQPEGTNPPIFAFPEFLLYSKIGFQIDKKQPFYSIEQSPYETVEDVAEHYIQEIKKIYSHGPYILAGYCNWAKIAVEAAQKLIAGGDEVPALILIEYYNPQIKIARFSLKFMRSKTKFIIKKLRANSSFVNKRKFLSKELLYALKYINKKFRRSSKNSKLVKRKYTGKVILLQASKTYGYKKDPVMGWGEFFTGDVKKFVIEGEHLGIMVDPASTSKIAEILNREFSN